MMDDRSLQGDESAGFWGSIVPRMTPPTSKNVVHLNTSHCAEPVVLSCILDLLRFSIDSASCRTGFLPLSLLLLWRDVHVACPLLAGISLIILLLFVFCFFFIHCVAYSVRSIHSRVCLPHDVFLPLLASAPGPPKKSSEGRWERDDLYSALY